MAEGKANPHQEERFPQGLDGSGILNEKDKAKLAEILFKALTPASGPDRGGPPFGIINDTDMCG